jgi:hypothetical protein
MSDNLWIGFVWTAIPLVTKAAKEHFAILASQVEIFTSLHLKDMLGLR